MGSGDSAAGAGSPSSGTASVCPTTLLLAIPAAELHKVSNGQQSLLARGQLSIDAVDAPAVPPPPQQQQQKQQQPQPVPTSQHQGGLYPQLYQPPAESGEAGIVLTVGGVSWELLPSSQTLKVGELSYVFSTPERGVYYTVTLAAGSDEEAVALLEAVLTGASVYRESQELLSDTQVAAGDAALSRALYRSSVARGVHVSSRVLASGLKAAAGMASAGISRGAAAMAARQQAAGAPVEVSPAVKKRWVGGREGNRATPLAVDGMAVNGSVNSRWACLW
ncbi:hypothetical protein ABPG77_002564 [Micractinium sp. CCAP 211/92]